MTAEDARQVHSSGELSAGDEIEAWHNGKLFHRGKVIRTVRTTDLFWIVDARTGMRRLIDTEALVILRAEGPGYRPAMQLAGAPSPSAPSTTAPSTTAPSTTAPSTTAPSTTAYSASGTSASNVPLFQAPGLGS
ncbi:MULTISPECIES: hypothetical protein [unclassified Arthrobacter]|uniref:hypothetical protein n=1 Tax=unclassified Arthrobacter TaxID=235627 RepID=UPI002DFD9976|nr:MULTISPECIES: hypothetical protein [unclassified Arthrobacter]MEC5191402.1 hypothetical protein [Arthrobacter sp. MP_M4]MEC5202985.1 hypothetical protein [Arthrobacter sp. MP_M7]